MGPPKELPRTRPASSEGTVKVTSWEKKHLDILGNWSQRRGKIKRKQSQTWLPRDPAIPLLGTRPREVNTGPQANICTRVFMKTFSQLQIGGNNVSFHARMKKQTQWAPLCAMESYPPQKGVKSCSCYSTMDTVLSKRSQTQKTHVTGFHSREMCRIVRPTETERGRWSPRARGGRMGVPAHRQESSLWGPEMSWK